MKGKNKRGTPLLKMEEQVSRGLKYNWIKK
jgi:hypothetical protein